MWNWLRKIGLSTKSIEINTTYAELNGNRGDAGNPGRYEKFYFEWNNELSTGNKEIDEQHKEFIGLINKAYSAMRDEQLQGTELLLELMNYSQYHFQLEENLMKLSNYPGYEEHKKEHETFTSVLLDIYDKDKFSLCYDDCSFVIFSFLKKWFTHHIMNIDKKMGKFLLSPDQS